MGSKIAKSIPIALSFLGALFLSWESYLVLHDKSICSTAACKIVGNYLRIDSSYLVAGGAFLFWLLSLFQFFTLRYPSKLRSISFFTLALAMAIDSSLLGFQFFSIKQYCLLCTFVAVLLVLVAISYCLLQRTFIILGCFILIWIGSFSVHAIMVMPSTKTACANMAFFSIEATTTEGTFRSEKAKNITLIISMNCPHCLDVISFLAERYPFDASFNLVSVDSDTLSLSKLGTFLQQAPASKNPFTLLKELKVDAIIADQMISAQLADQNKSGRVFLNNLGIKSIPILIVDVSENEKKIIIGATDIISFLTLYF